MVFLKRLLTRAMRSRLSKLDELYQRHAGEECYIFGDGISLKWMDLGEFAERTSILGCGLTYHKDLEFLKVGYVPITEPFFFYPCSPSWDDGRLKIFRNHLYRNYGETIIRHPEATFFVNFTNYPRGQFSNTIYVSRWYQPPFESKNPFRDRPDSQRGALYFQLSLAIFLGFKKAYLIGHDYTHSPSRSLHFYEKGCDSVDGPKAFAKGFIDYASQHIELTAITLTGGSETMKSVTYKEFTGRDARFRENTEIVDMDNLKLLAKWPLLKIF